jgi:hypothetical protein
LPSKNGSVVLQPTLNSLDSPASLPQITVIGPVISASAVGLQKKEVPRIKRNTAYLLAFLLAENEVNLVNALFNSVQSFGVDIDCVPHAAT